MKKIALSLAFFASLACGNESILGEFDNSTAQKMSGISFDAGMWYMTWDQTSTASDMLLNSSDALDTTYNIENSPAAVANLNMSYRYLSGNFEYYQNKDISGMNLGLSLLELIPYLNLEFRYVKADFKGDIASKLSSGGAISSGTFETKLDIADVIVYPFNEYIGFGYRTYKYEVPQDVYVINNSDGSLVAGGAGLIDISYEGSFYTAVLDNKRMVDTKTNYNGLVYSASFGIGKLKPKASGYEEWITESDAQMFDILVGYSYKTKSDTGFGYGLGAGYRYNKIETTANKTSATYSLLTEFNTEFHGPFIDVTISY
ncbi:hypothetical protein KJ877_03785 [bacterium]|nr:hypothetical protein [bacterium]MBU1991236.1 hypothetical protein [bacterium]